MPVVARTTTEGTRGGAFGDGSPFVFQQRDLSRFGDVADDSRVLEHRQVDVPEREFHPFDRVVRGFGHLERRDFARKVVETDRAAIEDGDCGPSRRVDRYPV